MEAAIAMRSSDSHGNSDRYKNKRIYPLLNRCYSFLNSTCFIEGPFVWVGNAGKTVPCYS